MAKHGLQPPCTSFGVMSDRFELTSPKSDMELMSFRSARQMKSLGIANVTMKEEISGSSLRIGQGQDNISPQIGA
jgi:hypothetical protein